MAVESAVLRQGAPRPPLDLHGSVHTMEEAGVAKLSVALGALRRQPTVASSMEEGEG